MVPELVAWHDRRTLKAEAVQRMRAHANAGGFVQNQWLAFDPEAASRYRGCFYGCLVTEKLAGERGVTVPEFVRDVTSGDGPEVPWHVEGERLWGIPVDVGALLDRCFDAVPAERAPGFAVASVEAIAVGADLSLVRTRFMLDLLADDGAGAHGVLQRTAPGTRLHAYVDRISTLHRRTLDADAPAPEEWRAAADAPVLAGDDRPARAAAYYAARAVLETGSLSGAAAVEDAADGIKYAIDAAAEAAGNRVRHGQWCADRLLHHLATAPVRAR